MLGANGAGKSTCLRMLYGVLTPDSGKASINGLDILGETSKARAHLGVLPHAAGLYNHLSARENIEYFGSLHGMGGARLRRAAHRAARALAGHGELSSNAASKGFSQGQRIKVALARALVHDPGNVVLDEPTNGLDVMAIRNLRHMLRALKTQGRCVLFSSHVMQEVAALCDRVIIIGRGRVLADATVQRDPRTQRRSDFGGCVLACTGRYRGRQLMRALFIVFAKEFLENLRDRRTLMSAMLFGPLFGPLLFGLMISRMLEQSVVESDEPLKITISGSDYAPGLTSFLESQGVKLTKKEFTETEARTAVRSGHGTPVIVMVPEEYPTCSPPAASRRRCCCSPTAPIRKPARSPIARAISWGLMAAASHSCGCSFAASTPA